MSSIQKKVAKPSPKISVNKLAEYITTSSPARRTRIIKDQKYPQGFIVSRYNGARSTIVDFFVKGRGDQRLVESKISELVQRSFRTEFGERDNQLSIAALRIFRKSHPLDLSGFTASRGVKRGDKLKVKGVDVSIDPDVVFEGKFKGKPFVGAIKLYIIKGNPLSVESGKYVCTLLRNYLERTRTAELVRPEFCILLDIFQGKYFVAPKAFKTLRKEIEAACEEISALWEKM